MLSPAFKKRYDLIINSKFNKFNHFSSSLFNLENDAGILDYQRDLSFNFHMYLLEFANFRFEDKI